MKIRERIEYTNLRAFGPLNNIMKKNNSYRYPKTQREKVNGLRTNEFEKEKSKGQTFTDWFKSKPKSYLRNIPLQMAGGGKVIMLSDYLKQKEKPRIKKINLDAVAPGKAISQLTDAEKEVVRTLLRLSMGRDD